MRPAPLSAALAACVAGHDRPVPALWDVRHRRLAAACAAVLVLFSTLGLHGFSLPHWHAVLDRTPKHEVLLGRPRAIRSDDWGVVLPFFLAQSLARPRLPDVNPAIGLGQQMTAFGQAPVLGPVFPFRPTTWGFVLGPDVGMGWMWWSRVIGLFYGAFLTFLVIGRRFWGAVLGATLLLASPFVQFWSLNNAENYIFAFALFLTWAALLEARRLWQALAAYAGLSWSAIGLGLVLYPPYQIPVALVASALAAAHTLRRAAARPPLDWGRAASGVFVVVAAVATFGLWFVNDAGAALSAIVNSEYPGRRFAEGGTLPAWQLLGNLVLLPSSKVRGTALGNECEAAAFFYLFPLTLALVAATPSLRRHLRRDVFFLAICAVLALLLVWAVIGLPQAAARALLLDRVPPTRTHVGIGLADVVLSVLLWARLQDKPETPPVLQVSLAAGWGLLLLGIAAAVAAAVGALYARIFAMTAVWIALGIGLAASPRRVLPAVALVAVALTIGFNPLVRGGTDYLLQNPVSLRIRDLHAAEPQARWAFFESSALSHLMPVLGVPTLGGVHYYPRVDLWRELDPAQEQLRAYNRYAHIELVATERAEPRFETPQPDVLRITVSPLHPAFARWRVRYFVAGPDDPVFARSPCFAAVADLGGRVVFRAERPPGTGGCR